MPASPHLIPKSRLWRVGATASYLSLAGCGVILGLYCFVNRASASPEWWVLLALAVSTTIPSLVCAAGVVFGKYRWEWVATAPLASGIGVLAVFEWLTLTSFWEIANALMVTSFALWIAGRCLKITLADREARRTVLRDIVEEASDG